MNSWLQVLLSPAVLILAFLISVWSPDQSPARTVSSAVDTAPPEPLLMPEGEALATARLEHHARRVKGSDQLRGHLIEAYFRVGHHDPQWDLEVTNSLALIAIGRCGLSPKTNFIAYILSATTRAQGLGCHDPYVNALVERAKMSLGVPDLAGLEGIYAAAQTLGKSAYPPDMKVFPETLAEQVDSYISGSATPRAMEMARKAAGHYAAALGEGWLSELDAYHLGHSIVDPLEDHPRELAAIWDSVDTPFSNAFSHSAYPLLLRGKYHYWLAWAARGGGFADTVSGRGWKIFSEEITLAGEAYLAGWKLDSMNSEVAEGMIHICNCESRPRAEMELWFQRAMLADPGNREACTTKLWYLEPQWQGSKEEMLEFARSCITNTAYTGRVPTTIADAHTKIASNGEPDRRDHYFAQKTVWKDISAGYEEVLRRDPADERCRNEYARWAFKCGQWKIASEAFAKLTPPDYEAFGGKQRFEQNLEVVNRRAGSSKVK